MDFNHLKALEVQSERTAEYTFYQIVGEPVLIVSPATEANKPYFNALLKRSRKNSRRITAGSFTAAVIEENRDDDRVLYPKLIVKGWRKVSDSQGVSQDFSLEKCTAFLAALPDWLFDELRQFCIDPQNFIDDLVDVDELAGNSPQG